jgi:hypothetical protein
MPEAVSAQPWPSRKRNRWAAAPTNERHATKAELLRAALTDLLCACEHGGRPVAPTEEALLRAYRALRTVSDRGA